MEKTETKRETLNRLFKENGLLKDDVYQHKHYTIITRSGIEKIQYQNNIQVKFDAVTMTPELCVVKASALIEKPGFKKFVETFGSAGHNGDGKVQKGKEYQYNYYPEIAEKRALSRAVLKISDFYKYGVFGEDENDEFRQKTGEAIESENKPPQQAQPVKPIEATTSQENAQEKPATTLKDALQQIADAKTAEEVATIWKTLPQFKAQPEFKKKVTERGNELKKEVPHAS